MKLGFTYSVIASLLLAAALPANRPANALPTSVRVTNHSAIPYSGELSFVIPFSPGEIQSAAEIQDLLVNGRTTSVTIFKYHRVNGALTPALARVETTASLDAWQSRELPITVGSNAPSSFRFGQQLLRLGSDVRYQFILSATIAGEECLSSLLDGDHKILSNTAHALTIRFRSTFSCPSGTTPPLTGTTYLTLVSNSDAARFVLLLDNNTFERPISGGIQGVPVSLHVNRANASVIWHEAQAQGISQSPPRDIYDTYQLLSPTEVLADGASATYAGYLVFGDPSSPQYQHALAAASQPTNRLLGMVTFSDFQRSQLGPVGQVPSPRFSDIEDARSQLAPLCGPLPSRLATAYRGGETLQSPSNTGDQAGLRANLSISSLQAIQTQSTCPLKVAYYQSLPEQRARPEVANYWLSRQGVAKPLALSDFTEIPMVWGGQVHFDPSYYGNTEENRYFRERIYRLSGFRPGSSNYAPFDEEHRAYLGLVGVANLTGDPHLLDLILTATRSIALNYFNWSRYARLGAARAFGRNISVLLELLNFNVDEPDVRRSLDLTVSKTRDILLPTIHEHFTTYGFPAIDFGQTNAPNLDDQCLAGNTPITQPTGERCGLDYTWYVPFVMQALAQLDRTGIDNGIARSLIDIMLQRVDLRILAHGQPVTYFLMLLPSLNEVGGISSSWAAGWAPAALRLPSHAGSSLVLDQYVPNFLQPSIEGSASIARYWRSQDGWNVFTDIAHPRGQSNLSASRGTTNVTQPSGRRASLKRAQRIAAGRRSLKRREIQAKVAIQTLAKMMLP